MSTILFEFKDYIITDQGEIVFKNNHQFRNKIIADKVFLDRIREAPNAKIMSDPDLIKYNARADSKKLPTWIDDGIIEILPKEFYSFDIPDEFAVLDIDEYLGECLVSQFPDGIPDEYLDRLILEIDMFKNRKMINFLRSLIYIMDILDSCNIVHGIGRGSACASLIMYLIGVHLVDPIEYNIPITEFLR